MNIYCPNCEHECSEDVPSCPACGHPLKAPEPAPSAQPVTLTNCPDCGQAVSRFAPSCLKCGRPLQTPASTAPCVQTTERTGKGWKLGMLIGGLTAFVAFGGCMCVTRDQLGESPTTYISSGAAAETEVLTLIGIGGLGLYLFCHIGAWWRHD